VHRDEARGRTTSGPESPAGPVGPGSAGRPGRPPGPRGDRWTGSLADYEADRLGFLLSARDGYGGLVAFDSRTTIVNDLDLARRVLDVRGGFEIVGTFLNRRLSADGVAARGDLRRHLNAGLRRNALGPLDQASADTILGAVRHAVEESGDAFDPVPLLERAISGVITDLHFGDSGGPVRDATARLLGALSVVFGNPFALPAGWPTPANLRVRRRYRALRAVVDPLVEARTERGGAYADVATTVARSAAAAGHETEQISNLLIGSMLAAHRVPAAAAAWVLFELARSREWTETARQDQTHLQAVIREALRLYPPTWLLRRVAIRPVELGGYKFDEGHNFLVSPYVIHRDRRLFDRPDEFRPARWLEPSREPPALLTFGRGAHLCPGRDASDVVLEASTQALIDVYDLDATSGLVLPDPRTTLVPAGLRLRFVDRETPDPGVDLGGVCPGPDVLDPVGEALPDGLPRDSEGLADRCPRHLSGAS
jgi:cytochrome P450